MNGLEKFINRVKGKSQRKLLDVLLFSKFLKRQLNKKKDINSSSPCVWLDINGNSYIRFSYMVTKYLELEGYQVYLKPNLKFLLSLGDPYAKLIIEENKTLFSSKVPTNAVAVFSDKTSETDQFKFISNDYYSTIFNEPENSYHVPLGLHPNMYRKGLWNKPVSHTNKKLSIFFAGNFDEFEYKRLAKQKKFKMLDRVSLLKLIESLPNSTFPKTYNALLNDAKDGQIDIVNQAYFRVSEEALRQTIANYYFFIACPGVVSPLSHNLFEAMSVGAIPIIHQLYADMFNPKLENFKNAIIYDDENFVEKLNEALTFSKEQADSMRLNVINYYNENATPKAIVKNLVDPKYKFYFLSAGRTSVNLYKGENN
jgi:hypothetical protein